ncbi:hypothetical protein ABT116_18315 [Streptomyces sp. NPDC002130]|uniref:hypothetical protein n=1 Tax=Streptomyces sp. NPDC002130 TaxID=3155568 RepID=UPI003330640F
MPHQAERRLRHALHRHERHVLAPVVRGWSRPTAIVWGRLVDTAIALGAFTGGRTADALGFSVVPGVGGAPALPAVLSAGTRRPDPAGETTSRERV